MIGDLPPTRNSAVPGLRLPLGPRRLGPGAALSILVHALIVVLLVVRGRELLHRAPGGLGPSGGGGSDGATVNFFTVPARGPAAVDLPVSPPVSVSDLPVLRQVQLDLPQLDLPPATLPAPPAAGLLAAAGTPGQGPGAGGGRGTGVGTGAGADVGPGTGGEGGYIFVASPRTAILPPLAKVPGSVAGRTYRVRFWVAADGRVTRVEVDPPIADAGYGREFQQRMMAYRFYPARTRDGRTVASVVTVPLRIGN
ncbi:MAG TPA: hypothetical protein VFU41_07395 [Gemmatimonadales bacterium]|nr:hypothetical protein [Gemmatimonadales bacterium]